MSTRPTPASTPASTPAAAANADRLSQVLAAGLERQLLLETCHPCRRQSAPTAPTDLVVDYESEEQLRAAGARRLELDDGVPWDPISFDDFERADGRERDSSRVMILGCGHAFTLRTVQRHNQGRSRPVCPRMREHQTADGNYYLTATEQAELGLTLTYRAHPTGQPDIVYGPDGRMVRATFPDGQVQFFEGPQGQERKVRLTLPAWLGGVLRGPAQPGAQGAHRLTHVAGGVLRGPARRGAHGAPDLLTMAWCGSLRARKARSAWCEGPSPMAT